MGLFQRIRNATSFPGDSVSNPSGWMARMLGMAATSSGVTINEENALTVADVYKCVRVISEAVATLPWKVYKRREDGGRDEATGHPLYFLLHDEPNDLMTSFTYRENLLGNLLLRGKHFSYVERDGMGRVAALWPLLPHRCRFEIKDGVRTYFASSQGGVESKFFDDEILYIPGMTRDGYRTYSPIELHRETLGLSKASEAFGSKFFGMVLTRVDPDSPWQDFGGGVGATEEELGGAQQWAGFRPPDNRAGRRLTFTANTIPPDQAQFLQTRKFQRSETAGLFNVPPHMIGDLERSTNNNIEHQGLEFYKICIAAWLERIEQAGNRCLLLPREERQNLHRVRH